RRVPAERNAPGREGEVLSGVDRHEDHDGDRYEEEDVHGADEDAQGQEERPHATPRMIGLASAATIPTHTSVASESTSASAAPNGHRRLPRSCCTTTVGIVWTCPPPSSIGMM